MNDVIKGKALTSREQKVFETIAEFQKRTGRGIAPKELSIAMGYLATESTSKPVTSLVEKNILIRTGNTNQRQIWVKGTEPKGTKKAETYKHVQYKKTPKITEKDKRRWLREVTGFYTGY